MEPSGRDEVRRAIEVQLAHARLDADVYTRKLREKPFWRFRRRQVINRALTDAKAREDEALRLLGEVEPGAR